MKCSFLRVANCFLLAAIAAILMFSVTSDYHPPWLQQVLGRADETNMHRSKRNIPQDANEMGGAVYIRWGRTTCRENGRTELVYSGVAGGQWFDYTGGASNYLCLPLDPDWNNKNDAVSNMGYIHGAEYQMQSSSSNFPFLTNNVMALENHNVPCAVCMAKMRFTHVMIPAKNVCPRDWYLEYQGYLVSERSIHKGRTEYVCMDEAPEADEAGYRDENGVLFYNVEAYCGSLPCPPYVTGREITCAVCTK